MQQRKVGTCTANPRQNPAGVKKHRQTRVIRKNRLIFAAPKRKAMAKKGNRVQVILECTEHKTSGMPGTSRYVTTKNRKNTPERIELKKYNPILRRMTVHKEIK